MSASLSPRLAANSLLQAAKQAKSRGDYELFLVAMCGATAIAVAEALFDTAVGGTNERLLAASMKNYSALKASMAGNLKLAASLADAAKHEAEAATAAPAAPPAPSRPESPG